MLTKTSRMYDVGNMDILNNLPKDTLIIFPHFKRNELYDIIIGEYLRIKTNLHSIDTNIIADKRWKQLHLFIKIFIERKSKNNSHVIFTKSNSVKLASEKLKKKELVTIVLYEKSRGKGIYYIAKETKCPILIVKRDIDNNTKKYKLSYIKYNYYIDNKKPEEFMNDIKKILFK